MAVAIEIERNAVERAYDRWAPVYDLVFGPVFERGRRASLQAAERIGGRILEVGVGTGISLPDYSRRNRIVGVDISEAMLQKARERVTEIGLSHVEALEVMDAERLNFPDDSFDVVVAQYVVTAVPNPEAALDEFARVLKPGGEIILLSRVGAETGPRKAVEHFIAPAARKLGWRTEFPWQRYTNWVTRSERVYLIERRPMPPLGHFSLIRFGKHPAGAIEAQARLAAAPFESQSLTHGRNRMASFFEELKEQRWDDHRYYHHSRINQSLHLVSAISFLCAYALAFSDPAKAALIGWLIAMPSRQAGHFFFEPRGYDHINQASHEHKEEIKVGYNLNRKIVLLSIWALSPLPLYFDPTLFGIFEPHRTTSEFVNHVGLMWLVLGFGGLLFRTVHLFFIKGVQSGLVWMTKILTDPFHDIKLYHKAPLALLRGELIDPRHAQHGDEEDEEELEEQPQPRSA